MGRSEEEDREWISAREAVDLILSLYGNRRLAEQAIIVEASGGRITSRCDRLEVEDDDGKHPVIDAQGPVEAPFWRIFDSSSSEREREDWTAGTFIVLRPLEIGHQRIRAFGVEFSVDGLRAVFRLSNPATAKTSAPQQISKAPAPITPLPEHHFATSKAALPIGEMFRKTPEGRLALSRLATETEGASERNTAPVRKRDNPITKPEIKEWHRRLTKADKTLSVATLWIRAQADHPGRYIPRKMVEPFGNGRAQVIVRRSGVPQRVPRKVPRLFWGTYDFPTGDSPGNFGS